MYRPRLLPRQPNKFRVHPSGARTGELEGSVKMEFRFVVDVSPGCPVLRHYPHRLLLLQVLRVLLVFSTPLGVCTSHPPSRVPGCRQITRSCRGGSSGGTGVARSVHPCEVTWTGRPLKDPLPLNNPDGSDVHSSVSRLPGPSTLRDLTLSCL